MIRIDIPRRLRHCLKGQEPFMPGESYFSRLKLLKDGEYQREDFCPVCWTTVNSGPDTSLTFWKAEVPQKTAVEKKTDRLEKAFEHLKSALESAFSDESALNKVESLKEAFILALYLHRKKWLAQRGQFTKKGQIYLVYEVHLTEEMIEVPKMTLTLEDTNLQQRLSLKLQ